MRRPTSLVALITTAVVSLAGSAAAQPYPPTPAPRPVWDSRGWVMLGERTVNGRYDHDRIEVGRYEGRFAKLTMVVENSDMELIDFNIKFADNSEYHPQLNHFFREGQRTRVIDLPAGERVIRYIDIRYRNLPGDGRAARVQVWGFKTADAPPPIWDARGWVMLGEREVNGHGQIDRDRIEVGGKWSGRFSKITVVVLDGDLEMVDMEVKFGPGPGWHPALSHFFREGQRTRVIDFPANRYGDEARSIRHIEFAYRNLAYGRHAKVQVWAWRADQPVVVAPQPVWDSRGWVMLGETLVNGRGREDHDRVTVGRDAGLYSQLTLVVTEGDMELDDMIIKFRSGPPWRPGFKHYFRENDRTRVIQFPPRENGSTQRIIEAIDFLYRNLPGGGHARVQVWAR